MILFPNADVLSLKSMIGINTFILDVLLIIHAFYLLKMMRKLEVAR